MFCVTNVVCFGISGRVGVVIYGYAGEIKRVGTVNSVTVDTKPHRVQAVFDVSNQGNAHVRIGGQFAIWRAAKYPGAKTTHPIGVCPHTEIRSIGKGRATAPAPTVPATN